MPELDYIISEERHRPRSRCRICGESLYNGQAFYSDGYSSVHIDCEDDFLRGGTDDAEAV